jgi:hypothetical protein
MYARQWSGKQCPQRKISLTVMADGDVGILLRGRKYSFGGGAHGGWVRKEGVWNGEKPGAVLWVCKSDEAIKMIFES